MFKWFKQDALRLGFILGLLAPFLSLLVYYMLKFYPLYSLGDMYHALRTNKQMVTAISIPCLFLNIMLFTLYINSHRDKTAKGIFSVTLIIAIGALLFKFLG